MREGDEVLGVVLGDDTQTAIGAERNVKDAGDCVERDSIDNNRARGVNDGDFRLGDGTIAANR